MLGRKLYKTKLCILYQRGRCARESCSFAHGEAELRRFGGPANGDIWSKCLLRRQNGRWDYHSSDLRDKLGRRYSPHRRFSPDRDGKGRHGFQSHKLVHYDRGHSASRSPLARRGQRKRQQLDRQTDVSRSPKIPDHDEDQVELGKVSSYGEINAIQEQLKQTQLDIEMLDEQNCRLEVLFAEKAQEADRLSARTEDIERQLNKEQENYGRFSSNVKKFIKAHGHFLRAQEELKRSQSRLLRVFNLLDSDNSKAGINEEDSSVHVISGYRGTSPKNDTHNRASPMKKKLRFESGTTDDIFVGPGSLSKQKRSLGTSLMLDILSHAEVLVSESENKNRKTEILENDVQRRLVDDHTQKDINSSPAVLSLRKDLLPSTSMAAHAVDDFIEAMEREEKSEAGDTILTVEGGTGDNKTELAFLPPLRPPVTHTNYNQYQGEDEEVDVDMGDADGNSELLR